MKKLRLVRIDFALLGSFLIGFACLPSVAAGQAAAQAAGQPAAAQPATQSSAPPAGQPATQLAAAPPAAAPGPPQPSGQVVEEIITRVNNQIITRSEFERSKDQLRDEVKQQDSKDPDKAFAEREKDVLRDLVDQ